MGFLKKFWKLEFKCVCVQKMIWKFDVERVDLTKTLVVSRGNGLNSVSLPLSVCVSWTEGLLH